VDETWLIPPLHECAIDYMSVEWDEQRHVAVNHSNCSVYTLDFGGETSIDWVGEGILGHLVPVFCNITAFLHKKGYITGWDLFGAPYDFRMQPLYIDDFWIRLKTLVEEAYKLQGNQKVVLYGHSSGGFNLRIFLAEKVTREWKRKYIDRAIFSAPSFGGVLLGVEVAWYHWFPDLPESLKSPKLEGLFNSTPVIFSQFPNWHAFGNDTVLVTPDGKHIKASELYSFMRAHHRLSYIGNKLLNASQKLLSNALDDPDVDSYVIYNSAVSTTKTLVFKHGYDKPPLYIRGPGDSTVPAATIHYICNRWKGAHNRTVVCHDLKVPERFDHAGMIVQPAYIDLLYHVAVNDSWKVGGSHYIDGLVDTPAPNST
jgi:pimeloyl-ACP methyl ester carboxylesterase